MIVTKPGKFTYDGTGEKPHIDISFWSFQGENQPSGELEVATIDSMLAAVLLHIVDDYYKKIKKDPLNT